MSHIPLLDLAIFPAIRLLRDTHSNLDAFAKNLILTEFWEPAHDVWSSTLGDGEAPPAVHATTTHRAGGGVRRDLVQYVDNLSKLAVRLGMKSFRLREEDCSVQFLRAELRTPEDLAKRIEQAQGWLEGQVPSADPMSGGVFDPYANPWSTTIPMRGLCLIWAIR
jgi:hypothetical protein